MFAQLCKRCSNQATEIAVKWLSQDKPRNIYAGTEHTTYQRNNCLRKVTTLNTFSIREIRHTSTTDESSRKKQTCGDNSSNLTSGTLGKEWLA